MANILYKPKYSRKILLQTIFLRHKISDKHRFTAPFGDTRKATKHLQPNLLNNKVY